MRIFLLLLSLFGTASAQTAPAGEPAWRLVRASASQGSVVPDLADVYTLTFGPDSRYTAQIDCGRFGGSYTVNADGTRRLSPADAEAPACVSSGASDVLRRALTGRVMARVRGAALVLATLRAELTFQPSFPLDEAPIIAQQMLRTFVYTCTERGARFDVIAETGWEEALVYLPSGVANRSEATADLAQQVPSRDGVRYEADGLAFTMRGTEARLDVGRKTFRCTENPDAPDGEDGRRPVVVRGVGTTAGWFVSLSRQSDGFRIVATLGLETVVAPVAAPERTADGSVYRSSGEDAEIVLTVGSAPCLYPERGGPEGVALTLLHDGRTWPGCGQTLD